MKNYEQEYYDALYKIKQLEKRIKDLEDEIAILKGNKKLIEYIIDIKKNK